MDFIKVFKGWPKWLQIVSIIIPFVGLVVEILYRVSAIIKKPTVINIVGLVVMCVIGLCWVGLLLDVLSLIFRGKLFFVEE